MKKALFLCMLFLVATIQAQEPLSFEKVIQADSIKKDVIYTSLRAWFAKSTMDADKVLVMDDKDAGILIGNINLRYTRGVLTYIAYDGYLDFTIDVRIKDGRFKVIINNISHMKSNREAKVPDIGLITTEEKCPIKGLNSIPNQKVWVDIKYKMRNLSEVIFNELENTVKINQASKDTDW